MNVRRTASKRISDSLKGKFGENSRGWKGSDAGYVAKLMWIQESTETASNAERNHKKGGR